MSFFSEIAMRIGLSELALAGSFNVINYGGTCVYIEGVRKLLRVDGGEIVVQLKGARLTIKGSGMVISELSDGAIIKGVITALEFDHEIKK